MFRVRFWNQQEYHLFEDYGLSMRETAHKMAQKLGELFKKAQVVEFETPDPESRIKGIWEYPRREPK